MYVMTKQRVYKTDTPIRKWLEKACISQADLARELGVTRQTINGKVNGWMSWTQRDLVKLNQAYGLTADFILGITPYEVAPAVRQYEQAREQ